MNRFNLQRPPLPKIQRNLAHELLIRTACMTCGRREVITLQQSSLLYIYLSF